MNKLIFSVETISYFDIHIELNYGFTPVNEARRLFFMKILNKKKLGKTFFTVCSSFIGKSVEVIDLYSI